MAEKKLLTKGGEHEHIYWSYLNDVGTHEAAATVYLAEVIWTVYEGIEQRLDAILEAVKKPEKKTK